MRKIILLIVSVLALTCCTSEFQVPLYTSEDSLILNSQLETQNTSHKIFLSSKWQGRVDASSPISKVSISVNGGPKMVLSSESMERSYRIFEFDYNFSPSDVVEIEAEDGAKTTSAKVQFPKAVGDIGVAQLDDQSQLCVSFTDDPSQTNYYRLIARNSYTVVYTHNETGEEGTVEGSNQAAIYTDDPLITGVSSESGGMLGDLMSEIMANNQFNIFSDNSLTSSDISITFEVLQLESHNVPENTTIQRAINRKLNVYIQNLNPEDYRYFSSLNAGDNFGFAGNILVEPTIVPSNVKGGSGYVCAITASKNSIPLADLSYGGLYTE